MKRFKSIATFVLIGIMVMCIGSLAGWYLVLKSKGQTISWQDAARGFGFTAPSSGANGSTFENLGIGADAGEGGGNGAGGGSGGSGGGSATTGFGTTPGNRNGFNAYGPGGVTTDLDVGISSSSPEALDSNAPKAKTPRLWRVTKTPIAGFGFTNTVNEFLFAERATGYIFRGNDFSGEILRRTNTLMPKIYEAHFSRTGAVIYRYISETTGATQTFSGIMGTSTSVGVGTLTGVNFPNNILSLHANPDSNLLFYTYTNANGRTVAYTAPWVAGKTGKEALVYESYVGSWKPISLTDGRLFLVQKAQDGLSGSAFLVKNSHLEPVARAAPGLTFLPLDQSDTFVFGTSNNGILTLFAQATSTTYALSLKTIADKCVWAPYRPAMKNRASSEKVLYCAVPTNIPVKNFIQGWYMGAAHTADSWWQINLSTGETKQILAKNESSANFDVIDPAIDPSGTMIGFKNAVDGSLWVLRIAQ